LLLHAQPGSHRQRVREYFAQQGVAAERIGFVEKVPRAEYFRLYGQIDVALDPFPYGGGTTTCDALWMGVPVVTLPGATFAGRHTLSHLTATGFTETIARDAEHYVELAVAWAADRSRLADVRTRLRAQMSAAPLCDMERFAERFQQLLRAVWRGWSHSTSAPPVVQAASAPQT
jgi:predicted O-linked N-acetylglucosamine transferase (SPINDLY family)